MYSDALDLSSTCNGCETCVKLFDCPGFLFDEARKEDQAERGRLRQLRVVPFRLPAEEKGGRRSYKEKAPM